MELIDKALALCDEIEARQAELRELLGRIAEQQATASRDVEEKEIVMTAAEVETPDENVIEEEHPEADNISVEEIVIEQSPVEPEPVKNAVSRDLRKAFTINDRFRFRRELFGGDDKALVGLIDELSAFGTYEEAEARMNAIFVNREDDEAVAEFKTIVSNYFNGYHL